MRLYWFDAGLFRTLGRLVLKNVQQVSLNSWCKYLFAPII